MSLGDPLTEAQQHLMQSLCLACALDMWGVFIDAEEQDLMESRLPEHLDDIDEAAWDALRQVCDIEVLAAWTAKLLRENPHRPATCAACEDDWFCAREFPQLCL